MTTLKEECRNARSITGEKNSSHDLQGDEERRLSCGQLVPKRDRGYAFEAISKHAKGETLSFCMSAEESMMERAK